MKAIIVTGGTKPSKDLLLSYINEKTFIIGADKGCNCLHEYGIKPDLILGDFDSADEKIIQSFINNNCDYIKLNPEKDYADTYIAYEKAVEKGFKDIVILGATGTRIDHFMGSIGILLKALKEKVNLQIVDDNNKVYLIDGKTTFKGRFGETISFLALSEKVTNIKIKGAKYTLDGYDMTLLEPRALCNEFLDEDITISFDSGILMVAFSKD